MQSVKCKQIEADILQVKISITCSWIDFCYFNEIFIEICHKESNLKMLALLHLMITEITDATWLQCVKVFLRVIHFNPWLVQGTLFYFGDVAGNLTDDNLRRVFTVTVWWKWHKPLQWRHNGYDSVSTHQPHDCFLNRSFRRRSKKTSKFRVTGLCAGNSPGTGEFPHKWPVTRKKFPFDDVIMH